MSKPVAEWDRTDLEALIAARVAESLTLDYKASAALANDPKAKTEIAKDVSAFANSSGGRIVYGIVEKEHVPTHVDEGVDEAILSREWLENVITSNIAPRISGLVIKPINVAPGRCAFVVEIPATTFEGPHQASDKRYYRRFNFKSVPMEDYEVRDVMRRGGTPLLRPMVAIAKKREDRQSGALGVELNLMVRNLSTQPAMYSVMRIFVDERCEMISEPPWVKKGTVVLALGEISASAYYAEQVRIAPRDLPLFKEENCYPGDIAIVLPHGVKDAIFAFSINTPGMTAMRYWSVRTDYGKVSLEERFFQAPAIEMVG